MTEEQLRLHRAARKHDRTNSYWLRDAKGVECARVCEACADAVKARYRPDLTLEGGPPPLPPLRLVGGPPWKN